MEEQVIGKAVYGRSGSTKDWTNANWRLVEGEDNIYQILPPFGLLSASGRWFYYDSGHWGYKLSNGRMRSFRCIAKRNFKTKMVEMECPECTKIFEQKNLLETRKTEWTKAGYSEKEIADMSAPISSWLFAHNNVKGFWLNARRQDGQIGRLFLKITAKQSLDALIERLRKREGVDDPIGSGVWFNFMKIKGENRRWSFPVEVVMSEVEYNGRRLKEIKQDPITEEVVNRMKAEAYELSTGYKELTFDEIQQLVQSGGDPTIVDTVFGAPVVSDSDLEFPLPEEEETSTPVNAEQTFRRSFVTGHAGTTSHTAGTVNTVGVGGISTTSRQTVSVDEFKRAFGQGKK